MAISFNHDLIGDLANRRVVLFLGAGVSASATTNTGSKFKGWIEVLKTANERVFDDEKKTLVSRYIDSGDYLLACELLKKNLPDEWAQILHDEFSVGATPSDLHKAIFSLKQRIIITTNFDKLIETFHRQLSGAQYYPTVKSKIDDSVFKMLRDNNDYIIKLHGTIGDGELVFDKSTYNSNAYGNPFYSELLNVLLLTYTFVFIGFSMDDPAISSIVELYAHKYPDVRPHYIFTGEDINSDVADIWRKMRKLYIIPYDKKDNHAELVEAINSLSDQVARRRNELLLQI